MTDVTAIAGPTVRSLEAAFDDAAAEILAACSFDGTVERGRELVAAARTDPSASLYGVFEEEHLLGAYVVRRVTMMNEISLLAVAPAHRRRGLGKMCLYDALLRSGRRPLVVETDEEALGFYKAVGFKLVGKRKGKDGSVRYRLGWHAPMPNPEKPGEVIC